MEQKYNVDLSVTQVGAGKDRKQEEEAEKEAKFQAFSGKKYSLRG